eukprot:6492232-Amphidinium_carterae.1
MHFPHSWQEEADTEFFDAFNTLTSLVNQVSGELVLCCDLNTPLYLWKDAENSEVESDPLIGFHTPPSRYVSDLTATRVGLAGSWFAQKGFTALNTHGQGDVMTYKAWGGVASRQDQIDYILHRGTHLRCIRCFNSWEESLASDHSVLSCSFQPLEDLHVPIQPRRPPTLHSWRPTSRQEFQVMVKDVCVDTKDLDEWHTVIRACAEAFRTSGRQIPSARASAVQKEIKRLQAARRITDDPELRRELGRELLAQQRLKRKTLLLDSIDDGLARSSTKWVHQRSRQRQPHPVNLKVSDVSMRGRTSSLPSSPISSRMTPRAMPTTCMTGVAALDPRSVMSPSSPKPSKRLRRNHTSELQDLMGWYGRYCQIFLWRRS